MGYCKPFKRGVSWRSQNFGANATIYGPHSGNDDAAPIGTPVHAAGDGYIEWAGEFDDSYQDNLLWLLKMGGNIAVLNCGANEPTFVYGHLHSFTVKRGDWVRKGQIIAYSGNTGTATTGAHLHTEAVPPGYSLNSSMLGRVNPDIYLTEWPEDINTGSLSYAGTTTPASEEDDDLSPDQFNQLVGKIDELNAAHHVATREHVNGKTREVLAREPLVIHRLDELNTAHHVATREHVNGVRDGLLANFRTTIDLLKPTADAGAVAAAEAIYEEVKKKLNIEVSITAGGDK
jgi:murein DD-endopeptidase MepM/ murein hydrolase activator NlpD